VTALRIGVVGVGHMGQRHAEKTLALRESGADVTLAGVADADLERARGVASALGVRAARDAAALFREADAVVVAVPTVHHYEVVRGALEAGLDVLVEKPLAATLEQGQALLELAEQDGRVLQVGHLEWFNAATRMIHSWIRSPRFIEVHRMGPFPARGTDVDVVRDLMIHDIDILQQILGEEPESIEAIGTPVITDKIDIANARVRFPSGCIADLTASRVSKTPRRKMRFFQRDGYFSIDFLAQSASIHQRRVDGCDHLQRIEVEKLRFDPEDALLAQLRAFVDAARKRDAPTNSATSALGALRTALRVIDAMQSVDEAK
jgi:predicted dehydrogenase